MMYFMRLLSLLFPLVAGFPIGAEDFQLRLQSSGTGAYAPVVKEEEWDAAETAVIVCDVWDAHHSINAVRRMEEFLPRMNAVLVESRKRGATIIHAPSDCMAAYAEHPARKRALETPAAKDPPEGISEWCSRIDAEIGAVYPLDQSDGGEDDDPAEHAAWAKELEEMGRNPKMPWLKQSPTIEINGERDYISDKGDEVWNVLEARGIQNVILLGVHANMCVLGRPFGLRQMARNGKRVAMMRDMTDCMYNPARWPHVDHYTGNDLLLAYIEQYVCPTITSDQVIGGKPFSFKDDTRTDRALPSLPPRDPAVDWTPIKLPGNAPGPVAGPVWYRCVVRIPPSWKGFGPLRFCSPVTNGTVRAWVDGVELVSDGTNKGGAQFGLIPQTRYHLPGDAQPTGDPVWFMLRVEHTEASVGLGHSVSIFVDTAHFQQLRGGWQYRIGGDEALVKPALPAKFGGAADVFFAARG